MKKYFGSENGHTKSLETPLFKDISDSINKTYKKQMGMSAEMYDQLIGVPLSKEKTFPMEDFFSMKILKSNTELLRNSIETYSDFGRKMMEFRYGPFFIKTENKIFTDKTIEMLLDIFEKQTDQIKEFNNYFLDTMEKTTKGTSLDSSHMIENIKKNIQDNMDSSLNSARIMLKPDNKKLLEEINEEVDSFFKTNLLFWTDLFYSFSNVSKKEVKETREEKMKETIKETPKETMKETKKNQ